MKKTSKKPVIGILGGIASGKSFVSKQFAKLGCAVIDADEISHEVLLEEQIKNAIRNEFGNAIFDDLGNINRKRLAEIIFNDEEKVSKLNSIIHPEILAKSEKLLAEYQSRQDLKAIVLDIPLLLEIGWEKLCDALVFIEIDEKLRLQRAQQRGFNDPEQIKKREKFQISLDKKKKKAHYIVNNNSDISATIKQIAEVLSEIMRKNC